jgi:histidinol-phosphatase (PHP family)
MHPNAESLAGLSDLFYVEATRLKNKYRTQISLPIGFESEWIRPKSLELVKELQRKYRFDMFVGSVHHVHTIPIDFDPAMYEQARDKAGGSDERLFEDYFDAQYEMLQALKPPIVGHFDLIRLHSDDPERSFQQWNGVWKRIIRNLQLVADYKGLLELNSAALRKEMSEPYPKVEVCKVRAIGSQRSQF